MALSQNEHLVFLNGRVPTWISSLSSIAEETGSRVADASPPPASYQSSNTPHFKSPPLFGSPVTNDPPMQKSTMNEGIQIAASAKRKRTSSSIESQRLSISNRYRAQNAKVVFYDASAQKKLEEVVEDITRVKNIIRKERSMARMRSFCRPCGSTSDGDDDDDLDDDTVMTQVRLRRRRTNEANMSTSEGSSTNMENLDRITKCLDCAQDMCSMAAYQLLRDGDCRIEASRAAEQLEDVWVIVKDELASNEERSMEGSCRDPSSMEKASSCIVRPRVSVDSDDDDLPLGPIRLTSRMATH